MKVFVSSTSIDLAEHRAAAIKALHQLGHEAIVMDTWPAGTEPPMGRVLSEMERAEAWVGLFAWRYGDVPKSQPPKVVLPKGGEIGKTSITHWEYLKAREMKIPIISFLLDEKHPWPPHLIDGFRGAASELGHLRAEGEEKSNATSGPIQALRGELQAERVVGFFTEPADLEAKVSAAITVAGMSRQVVLNIAPEMSIALMEDSSMDGGIRRLATDAGPMQVVRIDLNTIWWSTRLFLAAYVAETLTDVRWFAIVTSEPDQQDQNPFIGLFPTAAILASTDHLPPEVKKFTNAAARAKKSAAGNEADVLSLLALWDKAFGHADPVQRASAPHDGRGLARARRPDRHRPGRDRGRPGDRLGGRAARRRGQATRDRGRRPRVRRRFAGPRTGGARAPGRVLRDLRGGRRDRPRRHDRDRAPRRSAPVADRGELRSAARRGRTDDALGAGAGRGVRLDRDVVRRRPDRGDHDRVRRSDGEAVADTAHRANDLAIGDAGELLAQVRDVDVDDVVVAEPVLTPHGVEQLTASQHLAGIGGELVEQIELDLGEVDRLAAQFDLAGEGADDQVVEHPLGDLVARLPGPARERFDPHRELAGRERLGHVVVGTEPEPDDLVHLVVAAGEHEDVRVRALPDRAAQIEPVAIGQRQIEYHEIGRHRGHHLVRLGDRARRSGAMTAFLEDRRNDLGELGGVFDDQDVHDRRTARGHTAGHAGGLAPHRRTHGPVIGTGARRPEPRVGIRSRIDQAALPPRRTEWGCTTRHPAGGPTMSASDELEELRLESTIGAIGVDADRTVPVISLTDLDARRDQVAAQLWAAATEIGFFQVSDHGIDPTVVDRAFAAAEGFFALPDDVKAATPWRRELNAGWESKAQVRPSTRVADQKESYQMTRPHMDGLWPPDAAAPGFRDALLTMEAACWEVAMTILSCLGERLGFDADFFHRAHDPGGAGYQSTVRLLHYFPMTAGDFEGGQWRAGAHTDYNCLTLLFQRAGQSGLQVCPGDDAQSGAWTSVPADERLITCNIGDMLMRWSDDRLKSTLHRVRGPRPGEPAQSRYSVAFFAQANKPVVIDPPGGTYEPMTAGDYLQARVNANFTK